MHIRLRPFNCWLEPFCTLVIFVAIGRAIWYFWEYDHFPQPFFYEPFDTWMDWFNPAAWAYERGAYDSWGSIYPPLSFVFLRIFSLSTCYRSASGYVARECDWVGLATLHGIFLLNVVLLWFTFRKVDRRTGAWRALSLGFSLPTLFGLERGNLIVVCFTCVILGFGPLLKSARLRWIAAGMAINFKQYIIAALFAQLLRRRWRWFEGAVIATIVIYLVTFALMNDGSILQIYNNIADSSGLYQAITFLDLWYAATYKPLMSLVDGQAWVISSIVGSRGMDRLAFWLPAVHYSVLGSIGVGVLAAWLRPEVVPIYRLTFFAFATAMLVSEPGGYSEALLLFFVFLERWKGFARCWAILASYILCMPFDIILDRVAATVQESYLAGHQTFFDYYVTVGPFVRPGLVLSIVLALSCATIRDVLVDVRAQGWQHRWRFRHDAPVLPRVLRPKHEAVP